MSVVTTTTGSVVAEQEGLVLFCDECPERPTPDTNWWWNGNCEHTIEYIMSGQDAGGLEPNKTYSFAAAPHAPQYSGDRWLGWVTVHLGSTQRGGALRMELDYTPENFTPVQQELGYLMPNEGRLQIIGALMSVIQAYLDPAEFPTESDDGTVKTPCPVRSHNALKEGKIVQQQCQTLEGKMSNLFCLAMEKCCIPCYCEANGFATRKIVNDEIEPDDNMGITTAAIKRTHTGLTFAGGPLDGLPASINKDGKAGLGSLGGLHIEASVTLPQDNDLVYEYMLKERRRAQA